MRRKFAESVSPAKRGSDSGISKIKIPEFRFTSSGMTLLLS
ncbi:MAG: hypothetical protein ABJO91_02550 [Ekhidna sp.]